MQKSSRSRRTTGAESNMVRADAHVAARLEIEVFALAVGCALAGAGCQAAARGAVDAGPPQPQPVTVKLGGRIADLGGDDTWPRRGTPRPLSMHAIEKPLDLTVQLPGGRAWRTPALRVTSSLDDALVTIDDVAVRLADGPSCDETTDRAVRALTDLGVPESYRAKRPRAGFHDAYPVEGCVAVTVNMLKRDGGRCSLYVTVGSWQPSIWGIHRDWPGTCAPADGG